jgi:hypothetical protein
MPDGAGHAVLDRECLAFARYLTGQQAPAYAIAKYREAHARDRRLESDETPAFNRLLVSMARAHSLGAWMVDAYTAVFFKRAIVRKKWVLLVAILESAAPTAEFFDVPDTSSRALLAGHLAWRATAFLAGLVASAVILLPVHLFFTFTAASRRGGPRAWIG